MKKFNSQFTQDFQLRIPVIMAPMFLVSTKEMVLAAMQEGILGTFPSLNFRKEGELAEVLQSLNEARKNTTTSHYGVNLIVQKSNPLYHQHLKVCVEHQVPFYITSLGDPTEVINKAHAYGAKVYCDVTNLKHAQKVYDAGCDGFIAVGQGAGGHAGPHPLQTLIPRLKEKYPNTPIIGAGGIANGAGILSCLALGAQGVSMGTSFITTVEGGVNEAYKNGIVSADMDDIVMTERLSGTPCSVINTPSVKKMGLKQNWLERSMNRNKRLKKYFKMLTQFKGMKKLESSIKPGSYQNIWSAGKSSALIHEVKPIKELVHQLEEELNTAYQEL